MAAPRSWMAVDAEAQKALIEVARLRSTRAPEFWLRPGESRKVRFRGKGLVGIVEQYSARLGGKFVNITCPPQGEIDLIAEKGFPRSVKAIYELIDIDGYTNRQGKRVRNIPNFWRVGIKIYQLLNLREADNGPLSNRTYKITRIGSGTSSTYDIQPLKESAVPPEIKQIPRLSVEADKYYAPPSESEQRALLGQLTSADDYAESAADEEESDDIE